MIVSVAQAQVFFLALTRVMAMIVHVPVLGGSGIPNRIKIGFGVLLAMVIVTWDPLPAAQAALPLVALAVQIARELLIGTLAGFGAVLTFGAIQMAGDVMGMGSGFRAAQMLNPALGLQGSSMNQFFVVVATLVFLAVDGHHLFLIAVQRTFDMLPLATALPAFSSERLLATTGKLIGTGVQIALPGLRSGFIDGSFARSAGTGRPSDSGIFPGCPGQTGHRSCGAPVLAGRFVSIAAGFVLIHWRSYVDAPRRALNGVG